MRRRSKRIIRCGIVGFMAGGSVSTLLAILTWSGEPATWSETDWIMFYSRNFFTGPGGLLTFALGGVIGAGACVMSAIK